MNFNDIDFKINLPKIDIQKIFNDKEFSLLKSLKSSLNNFSQNKHSFTRIIHPGQKNIIKKNNDRFSHLLLYEDSIFPEDYQNNHEELFLMFKEDKYEFKTLIPNLTNNIFLLLTNNYNIDFKNMEKMEAYIIYHILLRKMKKKIDVNNMEQFCYLLYKKSIEEFKKKDDLKKKRSEEDFKFLYKLFKKTQKNQFCKKRSKNKDNVLINYYFKDTAKKLNLDIEAFSDPSNNNYILKKNLIKKRNRKKKSLDFKFLKLIIKSEKFKTDFLGFLNNTAIPIYKATLKHKINSLLIRIGKYIEIHKKKNFEKKISVIWKISVFDYLINKKQCKIPWTISEIQKSIDNILNRIKKYSKQE